MTTLSELGIEYIQGRTTPRQIKKGIMFDNAEEQDTKEDGTLSIPTSATTTDVGNNARSERRRPNVRANEPVSSASSAKGMEKMRNSRYCAASSSSGFIPLAHTQRLHPALSKKTKIYYHWAELQLDYAGGHA